jgi:hypothetical protein
MSEGHLDLIARIHAGFDAQERLARSLVGRAVAVRGASPTELDGIEPALQLCGATVVAAITDAAALVAGTQIGRDDLREAAGLRIAILRTSDVTLIATTRRRIDRQREAAYRESVGRALADARRLVAQRDRRVAAGVTEPVAPGRGLHIRAGSDGSA